MSDDHLPDGVARRRFLTIQAVRLAGVALLLAGILTLERDTGVPHDLGYVLLVLGVVGFSVLPIMLGRRWRTPRR